MRRGPFLRVHRLMRPTSWAFGLIITATLACHPGNTEAKVLREECQSGDFAACNALGQKLLKGEYVLRDDGHGATLLSKACEGGVADACPRLGVLYQTARGVSRDSVRAIGFFQRGCDNGAMDGCTHLGTLYRQGAAGVPRDFAKAAG